MIFWIFIVLHLIGALTCLAYSHQSNAAVGTAACVSLTATNTRRVVIERVAIGAIVRRVDTGLGDDDCLGRGDVPVEN